MSNPSKQKGTSWEVAVRDYLKERGFSGAERVAQAGANDLGDIIGVPGFAIECKSRKDFSTSVAASVDEAGVALLNRVDRGDKVSFGVGIVKRKRRPVEDGYCIIPLKFMVTIMRLVGE